MLRDTSGRGGTASNVASASGRVVTARNALLLLSLAIICFQLKAVSHQHQHVLQVEQTAEGGFLRVQNSNCAIPPTRTRILWDFEPHFTGGAEETPTWQQQSTETKRPLNFVHIPKNGGSSIVQAAIQHGLNWGDCLFQQEWPGRKCPQNVTDIWPVDDPEEYGRVWWHTPIHLLPQNPYQNYDLFAILRNPYTRVISEFYYHCDRFPNLCKGLEGYRAAKVLNRNIQKALMSVHMAPYRSAAYYYHEGHWIPQSDFVMDRKRRRYVNHVLHMETLDQELPSLLRAYNLSNMVLPPHPVKGRGDTYMDHRNLTLATMKFIEVVYERDFVLGGYRMLSSQFNLEYDNNNNNEMKAKI
jgi:hypothetical protein